MQCRSFYLKIKTWERKDKIKKPKERKKETKGNGSIDQPGMYLKNVEVILGCIPLNKCLWEGLKLLLYFLYHEMIAKFTSKHSDDNHQQFRASLGIYEAQNKQIIFTTPCILHLTVLSTVQKGKSIFEDLQPQEHIQSSNLLLKARHQPYPYTQKDCEYRTHRPRRKPSESRRTSIVFERQEKRVW